MLNNQIALPESAETLAEILSDAGYRTGAVVGVRREAGAMLRTNEYTTRILRPKGVQLTFTVNLPTSPRLGREILYVHNTP